MVHASLVVHQSFPGIHYTKNGKEKMLSTFVTVVKQKWVYKYYVFCIINNVENLTLFVCFVVFVCLNFYRCCCFFEAETLSKIHEYDFSCCHQ